MNIKPVDPSLVPLPTALNVVCPYPIKLSDLPNLDSKLKMLVPPAVSLMIEELDNILQKIIDDEYSLMQYTDNNMNNYLSQFELPQCLSPTSNEIPADLWSKIKEF